MKNTDTRPELIAPGLSSPVTRPGSPRQHLLNQQWNKVTLSSQFCLFSIHSPVWSFYMHWYNKFPSWYQLLSSYLWGTLVQTLMGIPMTRFVYACVAEQESVQFIACPLVSGTIGKLRQHSCSSIAYQNLSYQFHPLVSSRHLFSVWHPASFIQQSRCTFSLSYTTPLKILTKKNNSGKWIRKILQQSSNRKHGFLFQIWQIHVDFPIVPFRTWISESLYDEYTVGEFLYKLSKLYSMFVVHFWTLPLLICTNIFTWINWIMILVFFIHSPIMLHSPWHKSKRWSQIVDFG